MAKNIVIFASGDVDKLVQRLKIGTPNLELVAGDIVTEDIQQEMKLLAPNQFDYNLLLRREKMSNELMQGIKDSKEIVIIDTKKSRKFLEVYKKSAEMYKESRPVINLTVTNGNMADHSKELFLVKGDQYELLKGIVTKPAPLPPAPPDDALPEVKEEYQKTLDAIPTVVFAGIESKSIEELEDTAITQVNKGDLSLLTINTNVADDPSRSFLTRLGGRKGFAVVTIESTEKIPEIPEDTEEESQGNTEVGTNSNTSTEETSENEEGESLNIFQDAWWRKNYPNNIYWWQKDKKERLAAREKANKPIVGNPEQLAKLQEKSKSLAAEKSIVKEEAKEIGEVNTA